MWAEDLKCLVRWGERVIAIKSAVGLNSRSFYGTFDIDEIWRPLLLVSISLSRYMGSTKDSVLFGLLVRLNVDSEKCGCKIKR